MSNTDRRTMDPGFRTTIESYFEAFEAQDAEAMPALFTADAEVVSSVFGTMRPTAFFPMLFTLCQWTRIGIHRHYRADDESSPGAAPAWAVHFDYQTKPRLGRVARVDCIDLFEFDADSGRIRRLTPVCDSRPRKVPMRGLLRSIFERRHPAAGE